jgi:DNA-binding CsgD family transcriptional regulator
MRHSSYIRRAVPVLAARDAERLLRFVGEAEELAGDDPFTPDVLEAFGELIDADGIGYCEQDRVRRRIRLGVDRPGDEWESEPDVSYWDIADEHPVCSRRNAGDFRALMLSDFVSLTELRRSRIYHEWFRPLGVDRELGIPIPSPPWHTRTFLFHRGRSAREFTERDRLVLDLLQPQLERLWLAARTRRMLRTAMACLDAVPEHDARGVIFLDLDDRIVFASPPARRLLHDYFGLRDGTALPTVLVQWLDSGAPSFTTRAGNRCLTIERSDEALLLQETVESLGLTPRERQILAWVARGKSNVEVAETLWIAPSTVRKHLENIYAKLGVGSRTAAVARFLETLDGHSPAEIASRSER